MENLEPDQASAAAPLDSLQFQRAEISEKQCAACSSTITAPYFQLSGADLCSTCAGQWQALQQPPSGSALSRGILYGFGAAIAGAILMAVITAVTGYQFALAAIAVGWMVGKGFRKGTGGLGSRRSQWLAVALTYFGITASTVPEILQAARTIGEKAKTRQAAAAGGSDPRDLPGAPLTAGQFAGVIAVLIGLGLLSPFLMLTSGISGLINAVIVFFGLQQAWRLTAGDPRELTGPMEPAPIGAAAP